MSEVLVSAGIAYVVITLIVFAGNIIRWLDSEDADSWPTPRGRERRAAEHRDAARRALTAWAWPLWGARGVADIYRDLYRDSKEDR